MFCVKPYENNVGFMQAQIQDFFRRGGPIFSLFLLPTMRQPKSRSGGGGGGGGGRGVVSTFFFWPVNFKYFV